MKKVLIFIFCIPVILKGQDMSGRFATAVQLAENGKYTEALDAFREISASGWQSTALDYNLGTAYLHLDSIGKAILYLERALKKDPNNEMIRKNINRARERIFDPVIPVTPFFLSEWLRKLNGSLGPGAWTWLGLLFLWITAGSLVLAMRRSKLRGITVRFWMVLASAACSVFFFSMVYVASQRIYETHTAILMARRTELKVGPDQMSTSYGTIYEGEKVEIRNQIGDWIYVELLNQDHGWIPGDQVERI